VGVEGHRVAALAPEELMYRHPCPLAFYIPQRHVRAGQGVVQDRAAAPVRTHVGRLVDILDIVRVAADEERLQILLDGRDDGQRALGERGASEAVELGLVGLDLDDHEPYSLRRRADRCYVRDLHLPAPWPTACSAGVGS
jgi:hypothetical protein